MHMLALTQHQGGRIAEVGFLLGAIGGAALLIGAAMPFGRRGGNFFGGLALCAGSVLLIVATHWGHFG